MGVINVLSTTVINKIAAGEVIERPASVVKELVENSLDAGSSSVTIELEDGGRKLIRVIDNGDGMSPDDLELAFHSHATSKLKSGEDLFSIQTLGFRGEALASIGSISHARIISRLRDSVEGGEVDINGGVQEPLRAKGAPTGTTVEVGDLFFNTPARRKFLRSAATELAHTVDLVTRIALAKPNVHFRLINNGRENLDTHACEDPRHRIADLFGKEMAEPLIVVDSGDGPIRITGYAAPPTACRGNSKLQMTYVNGRFVRDRGISHAIAAAYEGLLMQGRYPVIFLFLEMDPGIVDVNVHPTKIEVRFQDGQMVYKTVLNAVSDALKQADLTPRFSPRYGAFNLRTTAVLPSQRQGDLHIDAHPERQQWPEPFTAIDSATPTTAHRPMQSEVFNRDETVRPTAPHNERADERPPKLFQIQNSYILDERSDGIAIVDQHALHERIIFNEIMARLERAPLESQRLLIPSVIHLSKPDLALALSEKETLAQLGIEIAEFGPDAVAVSTLPLLIRPDQADSLLNEFLSELRAGTAPASQRRLSAAKLVACKAAVKAGDRLTDSEMKSLLQKSAAISESETCPHGRPTCIFLPFSDLEKQFGRK